MNEDDSNKVLMGLSMSLAGVLDHATDASTISTMIVRLEQRKLALKYQPGFARGQDSIPGPPPPEKFTPGQQAVALQIAKAIRAAVRDPQMPCLTADVAALLEARWMDTSRHVWLLWSTAVLAPNATCAEYVRRRMPERQYRPAAVRSFSLELGAHMLEYIEARL